METFGEYDPATPLAQNYCSQISSREYEAQGSVETYAALQNLLEYMDSNSDVFRKILARKKQEEAENEGLFSFLKCKVLERVKGPNFMMAGITDNESKERLQEMQNEMCDVFNYVQDTKSSPVAKRFSKRLAAKRVNRSTPGRPKRSKGPAPPPPPPYPPPGSSRPKEGPGHSPAPSGSILGITPSPRKPLRYESSSGSGRKTPQKPSRTEAVGVAPACPPVAPPPPPPPLPSTTPKSILKKPLQERTNTVYINTPTGLSQSPAKKALLKSEPRLMQLKKAGSTTSLNSISSVHDELMGFDKGKLKSAKARSPGRIPKKKVPSKPARTGRMGDINLDSFNLMILEKFKNVHSPSRYGSPNSECNSLSSSGFGSPSGFTP